MDTTMKTPTTTTTTTNTSMLQFLLCLTLWTLLLAPSCQASWGTPDSSQYHIQTDEGPERYFKYQTDNGQYRKERRLEDGTVIGTEAWIDATGYLRQKDYIADSKGYRILKSKTVFVGRDRPIQEAIKAAKKSPPSAGTLVNSLGPPRNALGNQLQRRGGATYQSTAAVANPLGYDHYNSPNDIVRSSHVRQPPVAVYLPADQQSRPTPIDGSRSPTTALPTTVYVTPKPLITSTAVRPLNIQIPANGLQTPFTSNAAEDTFHTPIAVYSSTPTPIPSYAQESSTLAYDPHRHLVQPGAVEHLSNHIENSTPRSPIDVSPTTPTTGGGHIHPTTYRPKLTYEAPSNRGQSADGVRPIFDRSSLRRVQSPLVSSNALGNGYDPQYPQYDGVSQTANGFQYYLPRHYHEEDSSADGQRRAGSFGYVDPFGIRRVVYYNASPEGGFVHRKNNRYVGFGATPYDPRPL